MKFTYLFVPILAMVVCGTLQAQSADTTPSGTPGQEGFHHHWGHHRHGAWIWRKLNLSDAQKAQIKSIRQGQKGEFRPALAALLTAKMQLNKDIAANNQEAIPADTTALATAEAKIATLRSTQFNQIKGVLNQDQLTTLNDFKQKQEARTQDKINKLNQPES
jgi:Spy/CpxP family protein refolding chaperone